MAKALHITQRSSSSRSSIPGAVVSVFVAGNSTSHAQHLTQLNVRVKLIPETFYTLAALNTSLHSDITNFWSNLQLCSFASYPMPHLQTGAPCFSSAE